MQTSLDPKWETLIDLTEVDTILRSCVHCGFCTSGCPTYQLLGDENDSPRGRIYLMKQVFEGDSSFETVAPHLDRCLSCRSCETNCPSGVEYGRLLDISRGIMHQTRSRFNWGRLKTTLLMRLLRQNWLMDWLFSVGRVLRRFQHSGTRRNYHFQEIIKASLVGRPLNYLSRYQVQKIWVK